MARLIPVEIFRKKMNTFRGITFFRFLPKHPKLFVPFVWLANARLAWDQALHWGKKEKSIGVGHRLPKLEI